MRPNQKMKSLKFKPKLNAPQGQISFLSQVQCVVKVQEMRQHRWQCLRASYFGAKTVSCKRRSICSFLPPTMMLLLPRPTYPQSSQIHLFAEGWNGQWLLGSLTAQNRIPHPQNEYPLVDFTVKCCFLKGQKLMSAKQMIQLKILRLCTNNIFIIKIWALHWKKK